MHKDEHFHFTGALPLSFVSEWSEDHGTYARLLQELGETRGNSTCMQGECESPLEFVVSSLVGESAELPYGWFYSVYRSLQRALRPARAGDLAELYQRGYEAIFGASAERRGAIFVSAGASPAVLDTKIQSFVAATRDLDSSSGIRVTLSRTSAQSTTDLMHFLRCQILADVPGYTSIVGIDISGDERAMGWETVRGLIRDACCLRDQLVDHDRQVSVSVHAGEELAEISGDDHLMRFQELLEIGIDSIGHGVFLWIPEECLQRSSHFRHLLGREEQRLATLQRFVDRNVQFELCPTTSLVTQPLRSVADLPTRSGRIPLSLCRIGTDSPSLLLTSIDEEWELAGA